MSSVQLGVFIDYLVKTFTAGKVAGYPLQVIDGPTAADIRNNVLFIGHSIISPTYTGAGNQQWATLGRPANTRKEALEVNCCLRVGIGNKDMAGCRNRACLIFEELATMLRGSPAALPGTQFQQIQLGRYRLYQEFTGDGVSVTIDFTVTAATRV